MFDRSVLFVGSGGIGVAMLAEAIALDCVREAGGPLPLRVYSATMHDAAQSDPVMLRAMQRLSLDTTGLSSKPLALYAFAGAPRIDHVVMLGATLPPASRLALGDGIDVRRWEIHARKDQPSGQSDGKMSPGNRYLDYMRLAEALREPIRALVGELTSLGAVENAPVAHTA